MNLKTAYRYQNYLAELMNTAKRCLSTVKTTVTEEHQKTARYSEAQNETIVRVDERYPNVKGDAVIRLMYDVFNEQNKVTQAVSEIKRKADFDIDAEINNNKKRREFSSILSVLTGIKSSEVMTTGSDVKFNAEGNQVSYTYPVKRVTTINFDRDKVIGLSKKLNEEADLVSDKADEFMLTEIVNIEPKFDIHESFDDVLAKY